MVQTGVHLAASGSKVEPVITELKSSGVHLALFVKLIPPAGVVDPTRLHRAARIEPVPGVILIQPTGVHGAAGVEVVLDFTIRLPPGLHDAVFAQKVPDASNVEPTVRRRAIGVDPAPRVVNQDPAGAHHARGGIKVARDAVFAQRGSKRHCPRARGCVEGRRAQSDKAGRENVCLAVKNAVFKQERPRLSRV